MFSEFSHNLKSLYIKGKRPLRVLTFCKGAAKVRHNSDMEKLVTHNRKNHPKITRNKELLLTVRIVVPFRQHLLYIAVVAVLCVLSRLHVCFEFAVCLSQCLR